MRAWVKHGCSPDVTAITNKNHFAHWAAEKKAERLEALHHCPVEYRDGVRVVKCPSGPAIGYGGIRSMTGEWENKWGIDD
jgi:hypothetical protein